MKKKTLLTTLVLGSLLVPTTFASTIPDVTTTVTANTDGTLTATSKLAEAIHGVTNIYLGGMRNGSAYMLNRNELTPSSIILGTSESGSNAEYLTNRITSGNINMSYNKNGTSMASGMDLTGFQNSKDDKTGTYDYDGVSLTNLDSDGNVMEAKFTLDDGVVQGNENTGSRLTKNELKVFSNDESIRSTITDRTISTANDNYVFSMSGNSVSVINKTIGVDRAYLYNHGLEVRQADGGYVTFGREKVDVGNNTINRVADGVADTDAVNVKQLKDTTSAAATTVSGSGAVEVTTSTNSNGSTNYNVSLNTDGIREIAKTSNRYAGDDVIKVNRWSNPTGSADLTTFKFDGNEAAKVVPITYKANGENAQTTTASKGLNFVDGNHINASVDSNGVVKFDLDKSVTDRIDSNTNSIKANADAIKKLTAANTANLGGLTDKVNTLSSKVDENQREARRGIASASALAALHPLDYDPTHKVDVMAGVGHYRGNTAVALGAAYRPNENMMFTVGASINGKDSAINAGVSYKVGTKEGVESKYSKVAMQRHIDELNTTVAEQNEKIEQLNNLVEKLLEEVHQAK